MINSIEGCRVWISDKTLITLANILELEVFQLFAPNSEDLNNEDENLLTCWLIKLQQDMKIAIETDIDTHFTNFLKMISQE